MKMETLQKKEQTMIKKLQNIKMKIKIRYIYQLIKMEIKYLKK